MGKRNIEERIQEEAGFLLEELRKTKGMGARHGEGQQGNRVAAESSVMRRWVLVGESPGLGGSPAQTQLNIETKMG